MLEEVHCILTCKNLVNWIFVKKIQNLKTVKTWLIFEGNPIFELMPADRIVLCFNFFKFDNYNVPLSSKAHLTFHNISFTIIFLWHLALWLDWNCKNSTYFKVGIFYVYPYLILKGCMMCVCVCQCARFKAWLTVHHKSVRPLH